MGFIQRLQGMQNLWENRKVGKESKKKKKQRFWIRKLKLWICMERERQRVSGDSEEKNFEMR